MGLLGIVFIPKVPTSLANVVRVVRVIVKGVMSRGSVSESVKLTGTPASTEDLTSAAYSPISKHTNPMRCVREQLEVNEGENYYVSISCHNNGGLFR